MTRTVPFTLYSRGYCHLCDDMLQALLALQQAGERFEVAVIDVDADPALVARVRAAAEKLGYTHMNIISGAGHDACWAARVAPATMVMCPCVGGLSHNEAEDISKEWAAAGADVLFHAVVETAEIVP